MNQTLDPIARFHEWFEAAHHVGLPEPSAAALATVDEDGRPSVRVVLVRRFDDRGFVFFTNLESQKGRDLGSGRLSGRPVAINFYWPPMVRQLRIEGTASPISDAEADDYWVTRPRGSQIAAWASPQSEPVPGGRAEIEARYTEMERKFDGRDVPRPPHWSGLRVVPERIEFWEGRENRLHVRTLYRREGSKWIEETLGP
jgi:pyridoxamine 5'-phosphate oxidase